MQPQHAKHQAPLPLWSNQPVVMDDDADNDLEADALRARIQELEQIVEDYESLLAELPELFERKFQQRLDPLMERYRLLARAQQMLGESDLHLIEEPLTPLREKPVPFLERWRKTRHNNEERSARNAA